MPCGIIDDFTYFLLSQSVHRSTICKRESQFGQNGLQTVFFANLQLHLIQIKIYSPFSKYIGGV